MSVHRDRHGKYRVHYRDGSKQRTKAFATEAAALAYDASLKGHNVASLGPTLRRILPSFTTCLKLNGRSEKYIKDIEWVVGRSGLGVQRVGGSNPLAPTK